MSTALLIIWPLCQYSLQDDGFGNLVPDCNWTAAFYFAYGALNSYEMPEVKN